MLKWVQQWLFPSASRAKPPEPPGPVIVEPKPESRPEPKPESKPKPRPKPARQPPSAQARSRSAQGAPARRRVPAQDRYDQIVERMLAQHNVRVRRWRRSMSGVAFVMEYRDGTTKRWIESPRPRTPLSLSIFLHEIGHHALGIGAFKPRCLEEYHAWRFALETMEAQGVRVTDTVRRRMHRSLHYAVGKAKRRGIQRIPPELEPFLAAPPRHPGRA